MSEPTQPTSFREGLESAFAQAVVAYDELARIRAERDSFHKTRRRPALASRYEDLDAYVAYRAALEEYEERWQELQKQQMQAEEQLRACQSRLLSLGLPKEVWFRFRDRAIGFSFSDWGGAHLNLEVAPWSDELPSLDQRHRGD